MVTDKGSGFTVSFNNAYEVVRVIVALNNPDDGNLHLWGSENGDTLNGDTGNDVLSGQNGHNILNGGNGSDTVYGGAGDDSMTGGSGNDRFVFDSGFGNDIITDFDVAGGDILDFSSISGVNSRTDLTIARVGSDRATAWSKPPH